MECRALASILPLFPVGLSSRYVWFALSGPLLLSMVSFLKRRGRLQLAFLLSQGRGNPLGYYSGTDRLSCVLCCPIHPDFRQWLQEQLGEKRVQKVEVSKRLVGSAATLVQSSYGMSPTMARYMRAQAVAFGEQDSTMTGSQQVSFKV